MKKLMVAKPLQLRIPVAKNNHQHINFHHELF